MQVVELPRFLQPVGFEHRPLYDGGIQQQGRGVGVELQQFDRYTVDSSGEVETSVEVPVDIVFPARFDDVDEIERDVEFVEEVVFDHMVTRFDEHVVEFVGGVGVGMCLHLFHLDQLILQIGGVVIEVGMPRKAD